MAAVGTGFHSNTRLWILCSIQLLAFNRCTSGEPELNLTVLSEHAVLGQPVQLQCVLTATGTNGLLFFKYGKFEKCTVSRDNCIQYTPPTTTSYACGCTQRQRDVVTYVLNIKQLENQTVEPWVCEYRKKSNEIYLELTDPEGPDVVSIDIPSPLTVRESESVNLTCTAQCIPDCLYTWTRLTTKLDTRGDSGQYLVLREVNPDQDGNYTCMAVNPASNVTSDASLGLVVISAPIMNPDEAFSQRVDTSIGCRVNVSVSLLSSTTPSFTWRKIAGGTLTPVLGDHEERQELVDTDTFRDPSYITVLDVIVQSKEDLGMYCVIAENTGGKITVYRELALKEAAVVKERDCPTKNAAMPTFGVGIGIGVGGMLLITLLAAALAYRQYRQMKRELENPYATTDTYRTQGENDYQKAVEKHYEELPTPKPNRKQIQLEPNPPRVQSVVYEVKVNYPGIRRDANCNSVVVGKSVLNPVYKGFNPYEIPVTVKDGETSRI